MQRDMLKHKYLNLVQSKGRANGIANMKDVFKVHLDRTLSAKLLIITSNNIQVRNKKGKQRMAESERATERFMLSISL